MRPQPLKDLLSVAIVGILTTSALWAKFTVLPWWLLAMLVAYLLYLSKAWGMPVLQQPVRLKPLSKDTSGVVSRCLWGVFFCAPIFVSLFLTWNQEFPHFGDQAYHLVALIHAKVFWKAYWLPALALVIVIFAALFSKLRWNIAWIAIPLFVLLSYHMPEADSNYAIRYPGLIYFLQPPFAWFVHFFGINDMLNANRLLNALSVPIWLFVFRPLLVSRWPDLRLLPFVAFFFFQKDVVYYFTSGYLEPWPWIVVLLAIECMLVRGREELWIASVLLLIAAMMKDQFIFVMPLPLLAGFPAKRLARNASLLVTSLGAALTLSCYWLLRFIVMPNQRPYYLMTQTNLLSAVHLHRWVHVVFLQWQTGLPILLLSIALLWIAGLRLRKNTCAPMALAVMGIALCMAFVLDSNDIATPGYPRFYILVWTVFGAGLLIVGHTWKRRWLVPLALIILLLNGIPLSRELAKGAEPDPARNFLELAECSVFFPVRSMTAQADRQGLLTNVSSIRLIVNLVPIYHVTQKLDLNPTYAYKDIVAKYAVHFDDDLETDVASLHQCACNKMDEAVLFLPVYFANMRADDPERQHVEETTMRCTAMLKKSCSKTAELLLEGKTTGVIGIRLDHDRIVPDPRQLTPQ